jgi:hypothetical protein
VVLGKGMLPEMLTKADKKKKIISKGQFMARLAMKDALIHFQQEITKKINFERNMH